MFFIVNEIRVAYALGTNHLTCLLASFFFVQKICFGQHELEHLFLLSNLTLGYDKNSESDYYFFPPPKSEYFFQQHWESEYFFRKKTIIPPWNLNGPSLSALLTIVSFGH